MGTTEFCGYAAGREREPQSWVTFAWADLGPNLAVHLTPYGRTISANNSFWKGVRFTELTRGDGHR